MPEDPKQTFQTPPIGLFSELRCMINRTTGMDELAESAIHIIQSVLNVENCSIMLLNVSRDMLEMIGSSTIPKESWDAIVIPLGQGIAGRVAQSGKPMLIANTKSMEAPAAEPQKKRYQTDSFISIPLHLAEEKEVLGVLNVTDQIQGRQLTEIDLETLMAIGELIACAIHGHRAWQKSREAREHLSQVLDDLPVGMLTISTDGLLLLCNRAARRHLGLPKILGLNRPWRENFPPLVAQHIEKALENIKRGRDSYSKEFELPEADDRKQRSIRISAIETEDFVALESRHALILVEDINQMRELAELRHSHEMQSNFLSLISHELRTPLAAIKGAIHLLNQMASPDTRETTKNLFSILHRNSDRLTRVLNNVLDVMDLESGSLNLYRKRTDIHALLSRVVERFQNNDCGKTISCCLDLKASEYDIFVDESRVGQVFDHILENAIKFAANKSSVNIATSSKDAHLLLTITNMGQEIDSSLQEEIFTKFYQIDGSLTRETGGSGVGLYLCREIMRLQGGDVQIDPEFTGGARFIVSLPEITSLT